MIRSVAGSLLFAAAAALSAAAPTDQAIVAAMKLVDTANYTWTCYVPSVGRALVVREGKTIKSGYTQVLFVDPQSPMLRQIQRLNDGMVLAIFRGDDNFVFQTSDGWKTGPELPPLGPRRRGQTGGSDYWISITPPHEELEIIVGSYTEMHVDGDAIVGTLSEDGARQLLGSRKAPAVRATGGFKLWVSNGVLHRYVTDLAGSLMMGPPGEEKEMPPTRRLLLIEFKDVGRTNFEVPEEAKRKLSG